AAAAPAAVLAVLRRVNSRGGRSWSGSDGCRRCCPSTTSPTTRWTLRGIPWRLPKTPPPPPPPPGSGAAADEFAHQQKK
ncbi:unnamed protein product, partial [Ectocarpus sp. 12 AP-2014]